MTGNTAAKKLAKLEVIIATDLLRSLHRSEDPLVTHIVAAMGGNLGPTQGLGGAELAFDCTKMLVFSNGPFSAMSPRI